MSRTVTRQLKTMLTLGAAAGAHCASALTAEIAGDSLQLQGTLASGQKVVSAKRGLTARPSQQHRNQPKSNERRQESPLRIAAAPETANSPVLYGLVSYIDFGRSPSTRAPKIHTFHGDSYIELIETQSPEIATPMTAVRARGDFYCFYCSHTDDSCSAWVKVYDGTTWQLKDERMLAQDAPGLSMFLRQAATYDPVEDVIYFMTWKDGKPVFKLNLDTYEYTQVGKVREFIQALFTTPDGKLYGIEYGSEMLFEISKTNGAPTPVGKINIPFKLMANTMSAVCDPATGKVYWSVSNFADVSSYLYELDPATAQATLLSRFPGDEQFLGLYMLESAADAPAAPTAVAYANGKLTFTAPTKTNQSAETPTGDMQLQLTVDGTPVADAPKVAPGQTCELALPLADGKHHITLRLDSDGKLSPERRIDTYVGYDVPAAVTGADLIIKNDVATVSWQKPQVSMHGGEVDDATITYSLRRLPDGAQVASGLTECTYTEAVPDTHARYSYEITAWSGDRLGGKAETNKITAGKYWVAPYVEGFDTWADFNSFAVVDANNDAKTWSYMSATDGNAYAYLQGNGTPDLYTGEYTGNGNNDWLISLPAKLQPGTDYRVKFDITDNYYYNENLSVYLGRNATPDGSERLIYKVATMPYTQYSFLYDVDSEDYYRLMFQANNPGPSLNISMDNIVFELYAVHNAPAKVENLQLTAGAKGARTNKIAFNAPTATYKTGTLDGISCIKVYRNDQAEPAFTVDNPAPGQRIELTDNDVTNGMVSYRIVPFNAAGQGQELIAQNWIGLDVPEQPRNVKIRMNDAGQPELTFEAAGAVGAHGGYVNPGDVAYALYRYTPAVFWEPWQRVTDFTTATTLIDETLELDDQAWCDYAVGAINQAGLSPLAETGSVFGTPLETPYEESFIGGEPQSLPWTILAETNYYSWALSDGSGLPVKPYDFDNGLLVFYRVTDDAENQYLSGPRVSLEQVDNGQFALQMWHGTEVSPEHMKLNVYLNYDDQGWELAAAIPYNNGQTGWERYSIPLKPGHKNVRFQFGAKAVDNTVPMYVDCLSITQGARRDAVIEDVQLTAKRIVPGQEVSVVARVANHGTETIDRATVTLYQDGTPVATQDLAQLEPNKLSFVNFPISTTQADASKVYTYTVKVAAPDDSNAANNDSQPVSLTVKGSILPAPTAFTATNQGDDLQLSWAAPSTDEIVQPVTDDWEEYDSFIIDGIGDWLTYDGDGTPTAYFNGPVIPYAFQPKAWQVWAPEQAGFSLDKFDMLRPHSGDKVLACWAASDGVEKTLPNDDWLISPEIVGGTDVDFWYRMPNGSSDPQKFELLYSTTDREPESFEAFDSDQITSGIEWKHFEFTIPQQARYFALRSCCEGTYLVALLDDLTYTRADGDRRKLQFKGYNVYCDGKLIAAEVASPSYTVAGAAGANHTYTASAVWDMGESNFAPGVNPAGISDAVMAAVRVMADRDAIRITGAQGQSVRVTTPGGICTANRIGSDSMTILADRGVYIVTVGKRVYKVVVR